MGKRANILILMADQMNPAFLPSYGHAVVKAPVLEALTQGGVIFDSAYCNSPLCAPSRFAFMAGRLPSEIGAYDNAAEFRSEIPTFAHYLRHAGYRTVLSGKMHFCGADQLHGFEERLTTDIYPADFGWTPDWQQPEVRPSWYHNMSSVVDAGTCVRTNQLDFDDEVVFSAKKKLYEMARDADDRPFCMVVSMTHPHDPYAITQEYWDLYRDEDVELPRVRIAPEDLDAHSQRLRHVSNMEHEPVTETQIRAARRAYFGAISYVDRQFGALHQTLKDIGAADDTIIIVLGDHGDMLGERGLWYKMNFFEGGARIPLIVHAPKFFRAHRVAGSVSLIDILPTLAEIAQDGTAPDFAGPIEGRSLLPHLAGTGGHDEVIGEYLAEGALAPLVMIRRGRHKFIHTPTDPDQLYDLVADPDERRNLAGEAESHDLVRAFRQEVAGRWDLEGLKAEVIASQVRRRLVDAAGRQGKHHSWDHQPFEDAGQRFMRNHIDLDDLEAMARFPAIRRG
jgi:choline-sulfatase